MFDERNDNWITIYKYIVIALFAIIIVFGFIAGYGDSSRDFLDVGLGGDDDGFFDFIVWVIVSGGVGFIHLVSNMLLIQFLNNVQTIRKKIEKM